MQEKFKTSVPPFIARKIELSQGENILKRSDRNVLFLVGEAGVGKTRYIEELIKSVNENNDILILSCKNNLESKNDDRALIDLLDQLISLNNTEYSDEIPTDSLGILNFLVKILHNLLKNKKEIIIVIEDIHWASGKQLDVLFNLFTNLKLPGIKYCFTYRDEENYSGDFYSFIKEVSSLSFVHSINLKPLAVTVFSAIINKQLKEKIVNESNFISIIHRHCQGNPLKLQLLLYYCYDKKLIELKNKSYDWDQDSFENSISKLDIFSLIYYRIHSLDSNLLQVLRLYALIEEELSYENTVPLISSILGVEESNVELLLNQSIKEQIIYKLGEQLFFTHDRLKEALINHSGESHTVLHYRIAQYLKNNISDSTLLIAYHMAKGSSMIINQEELKMAIEIIDNAADILIKRNLPEQATWLSEVGISLCDSHNKNKRRDLLLKTVEAQIITKDFSYVEQILENLWEKSDTFLDKSLVIELYLRCYSRQNNKEKLLYWFKQGEELCLAQNEFHQKKSNSNSSLGVIIEQIISGNSSGIINPPENDLNKSEEFYVKIIAILADYFYKSNVESTKFLTAASIGLNFKNIEESKASSIYNQLNKTFRSVSMGGSVHRDRKQAIVSQKGEIENLKQEISKLNIKESELSNLLLEREREIQTLKIQMAKQSVSLESENELHNEDSLIFLDSKWNLSRREREICQMIRNGKTSKDIGIELNISYRTVDTYRNRIRKKFELNRTVSLEEFLNN